MKQKLSIVTLGVESITKSKELGVEGIVFLSVQGAEKSKIIPHNKIEHLIKEYNMDYIFLRPSYFMQNLTTNLVHDIKTKQEIILPAGKAKFNWVDIKNISEVAAMVLFRFESYKNKAYEITGLENVNFNQVAHLMSEEIGLPITFRNVNPFTFFFIKKREGLRTGFIIVMILLHFLPRFQKAPKISNVYQTLMKKKPTDLKTFLKREKSKFIEDKR